MSLRLARFANLAIVVNDALANEDAEFRAWTLAQLNQQPYLSVTRERVDYLHNATRVLVDSDSLSWLSRAKAEKVVWNMANGIRDVLGEDDVDLSARLALVHATPSFFGQFFGALSEYSAACDMFWDIVISYLHPGGELGDAIFQAISEQLAIPNRYCQLSALHGFNHLRDRRCVPLITAFEKTTDDPEIRAYAVKAKMFMAM